MRLGLTIALELRRLYPNDWQVERYDRLLGHQTTWESVKSGRDLPEILKSWEQDLARFLEVRRRYLLYND